MYFKKIKYCECGCGQVVNKRFVRGHHRRGIKHLEEVKKKISKTKKGIKHLDEHKKKTS